MQKIAGAIIDAILGLPLELLSSLEPALLQSFQNIDKFFTNILGFLGGLDPLSELFSIETAAQNFINNILAETGLLPILNEVGHIGQEALQPLIDVIAQAFGLSTGLSFPALESALANYIETNLINAINGVAGSFTTLLADTGKATIADLAALINLIQTAVNNIEAIISAAGLGNASSLGNAIGTAVSGVEGLVQSAVGTGGSGFPWTFPMSFGTGSGFPWSFPVVFGDVEKSVADVGAAILNAPQTGQQVLNQLVQSISGVQTSIDHSLTDLHTVIQQLPATPPLAVVQSGLTTAAVTAGQVGDIITHAVAADAAAVGVALANANTNMNTLISGVQGTVAADVSTAINTANAVSQGAVNGIYNAVNNANTVANQATATVQAGLAGFFTSLFNGWTGSSVSSASAAQVATTAAVNAKTIADTHTVSIETISAQLPAFYGGGGAGGLNKSVSMSGTLPAGFSAASTIAVASAIYNTVATTDTQTVSGAWSVTDTHAQYLFLRANAGFTTYVYAKIQANTPFTGAGNCEIGCVVSGVRHVFSTFALPGNFTASSNYSFAAVASAFTLSGPGGLSATYTDSGPVSQVGSSYRYGGFGTDGYSREIDSWSAAGTTSYLAPSWMQSTDTFDFVGVGGGGGGGAATGPQGHVGFGGAAGAWFDTAVSKSAVTGGITVTVGAVGAGGGNFGAGGAGGSSTVNAVGYGTLTGAGGAGGAIASSTVVHDGYGQSPGNTTFNNAGYTGGAEVQYDLAGHSPGGGGGGGVTTFDPSAPFPAAAGAPGAVWITANDLSCPGSLGFWAFYDAAVTGPAQAYVATQETTTSTTATDLATTTDQVTVNVGSSGMVQVFLKSVIQNNTSGAICVVAFALSGANTAAANTGSTAGMFVYFQSPAVNGTVAVGAPFLMTGLAAGATTFKIKYWATSGTGSFSERRIAVIPL